MQAARVSYHRNTPIIIWGVMLLLLATSCSRLTNAARVSQTATKPAQAVIHTPIPSHTPSPSPSPMPTATRTPTSTSTPTRTGTPTATPFPTLTPTYAILRGRVLMLSNCRYGPGPTYLYKYALIEGSNLEVFGRTDRGNWILIRAIGGTNPCWVKASLLDVKGDVMAVQPTYIPLPASPYYGPLKGVSANRVGDVVTIFWSPLSLRDGDDSGQFPYQIEAWVCVDGMLVFTPLGTYDKAFEVIDEAGCSEPSHGRIFGVEKHGYTRPVEIPWPPHE